MPMPESVPASLIIDTFKDVFRAERKGHRRQEPLGWILSVPDTHQKSVLAALDKERELTVLTCSTEDEANGVAAGLWMSGEPVIVMIQHAGLYASVNTLRGIAMDGRVPIFYMIGLLSREQRPLNESAPRHHHNVASVAAKAASAERDHEFAARVLALVVRLAIEVLVLEEEHRVVAANRGPQQARGVRCG